MQHLRLTHLGFDFWVDVRLRDYNGKWLAVADLAGQADIGTSIDPRAAVREAFAALGPRLASELAGSAVFGGAEGGR